jgi:hypothetical protein
MNPHPKQTPSAAPNLATARKAPAMATGGASLTNVAKPAKTAPLEALIAKRAYEIWLAEGQQPDTARQNWLQAELQLRQS